MSGFAQITFNYLLDVTPFDKRAQYIANYNVFVALSMFSGALLGIYLSSISFLSMIGLPLVFFVSFILTVPSIVVLLHVKDVDMKHQDLLPARYVFWRTVVEPAAGIMHKVDYSLRRPHEWEYMKRKIARKLEILHSTKSLNNGEMRDVKNHKSVTSGSSQDRT